MRYFTYLVSFAYVLVNLAFTKICTNCYPHCLADYHFEMLYKQSIIRAVYVCC